MIISFPWTIEIQAVVFLDKDTRVKFEKYWIYEMFHESGEGLYILQRTKNKLYNYGIILSMFYNLILLFKLQQSVATEAH